MQPVNQPSPYRFPINTDNPLEQLGAKYEPTKRQHNYLPFYWMHFQDVRLRVKRFLEIGVQTDRSMRMWEEFFPNAMIYGLDIDPRCQAFEGDRRRIFVGNQGDRRMLEKIVAETGPLDIVIDDGSHQVQHQVNSFTTLFPTMTSHGIYVIEDTGGCVCDYDLKTVSHLKEVIDQIFYWPKGFPAENWSFLSEFPHDAPWTAKNVIGIAFYRWLVFVMRGNNPGDNPYLKPIGEVPVK